MKKIFTKVVIFLAALAAAFVVGFAVRQFQLFPNWFADAVNTIRRARVAYFSRDVAGLREMKAIEDSSAEARNRFRFVESESMADSIVWLGGYGLFREYSPKYGCLAVEFSSEGKPLHPIPLRIDELERIEPIARMPYSDLGFSFRRHTHFFGLARHDESGDIFTTIHHHWTSIHPYGGGILRVDMDGRPIWWRRDYSHHAPSLGVHPEFGETLVTPGMILQRRDVVYSVGNVPVRLGRGSKSADALIDVINILRPEDGELLRTFSIMDAIRNSPHSGALGATVSVTDPLHVNSVFMLDDSAESHGNLSSGDLVVSMRSLSAVAILDGRDGSLKYMRRGSFLLQHAARHWKGAEFLMLDNHGTDGTYGPSRLLAIDMVTGIERTIFPNANTPPSIRSRAVTNIRGHVSISSDRLRAICTFPDAHFAVEVRLSDGELLAVFENVHFGLSNGQPATLNLNAIEYIPN